MKATGTMSISSNNRILVIGYGSSLGCGDAVGALAAGSLADRKRSNVLAISVTQLVPELATLVASARAVIFVDACARQDQQTVEVRELTPACPLARQTHSTGPRELLSLARSCYDRSPPAWLVTVPGRDVGISDHLSDAGQEQQLATAKQQVDRLIAVVLGDGVAHA